MKTFAMVCAGIVLLSTSTFAEIHTEMIAYEHDGVALEGYLAYPDDDVRGKRPGVLVIHEWWGLNDYAKQRARQLAELSYVAFAADMYGKGKATANREEAQAWSGQFYGKPQLTQQRAEAGLKVLREQKHVDLSRIAAIGYCFGGTTVLQLAYGGADIAGVVSFHGSLPPAPKDADIRARILVCHGADDPHVPTDKVVAFEQSLQALDKKADWQLIAYGGAVHSFTNPNSGKAGMNGVAYHADADRRSWSHMRMFFDELFAPSEAAP